MIATRAALTSLVLVASLSVTGLAGAEECTTNPLDSRCELWSSFADSPWASDGFGEEAAFDMTVSNQGPVVTGYTSQPSGNEGSYYDWLTAGFDERGSVMWTHRYDNGASDRALAIAASPDGDSVYVTGESTELGSSLGMATIAYSATGGVRWAARLDGVAIDRGQAVVVSPDSQTVYVGGETGVVDKELFVRAYDAATGAVRWTGSFQGENTGAVTGIAVSPDGSRVFLAGYTGGGGRYAAAAFRAATEDPDEAPLGELLWSDQYEPGASPDRAAGIAVSPDGETVYVTGTKLSGGAQAVTLAYQAETGARRWLSAEGPAGGSGWGNAVAVSPDGGTVFVAGDHAAPAQDSMVVALNTATGTRRWLSVYGSIPFVERATSIAVAPGGSELYVTVFSTVNVSTTHGDVATISYDPATGTERWVARFNGLSREVSGTTGADWDHPVGVGITGDGSRIYVGGTFDRVIDPTHAATNNVDLGVLAYEP